jgi:D-alanine-D-alanine ligase
MKIGITYDLKSDYLQRGFNAEDVAEFDRPETIEAIENALRAHGYTTDRIGSLDALLARLVAGDRWDLVFNFSEGLRGYGRESAVPAVLDQYDIPYVFSDPLALAVTLHKPTAKRILRDNGVPTPEFRVIRTISEARKLDLQYPVFVKPVAEGSSKGITIDSRARNNSQAVAACRNVFENTRQPALVETYLSGREFTVGMVGAGADTEVLGVMEIIVEEGASTSYSLEVKSATDFWSMVRYEMCRDAAMRRQCEKVATAAWRALRCRDGGRVDLRADAQGRVHVLEVNPLPGMHPTESDLTILAGKVGISHEVLIGRIMLAAHQRLDLPVPAGLEVFAR